MKAISSKRIYSFTPQVQQEREPYPNLQQSEEYILEVYQSDSTEEKCRKIGQINQNLSYNISLLEVELEGLKKCQSQKISENNKIKEKLRQKTDKELDLKRHLKAQAIKIKKFINGFKNICCEIEEVTKKQQEIRQSRLNAQQIKNEKYEQYNLLQKEYRELIVKIKDRDGLDQALQDQYNKNEELLNQIDQIQGCLSEEKSFRENADAVRKQRSNKIRELNEKVLALQKQQTSLKNQINQIQRNQMIWQNQKQKIEEKSAEAIKIYQQIQESKNTLMNKKLQYTELDSTYKQICIQENRLKKQIFLQKQCEQQRKRYKQTQKKKPVQNELRQVNNRSPIKTKEVENLESGSSYHNLLKRYENMNRKK